ncbi:hypothetical protein LIER_28329 [Lithospermum erythrorhizon]|uniref:MORF/ORRM1/DAG-like MORF domain-containing protein n=1 Tax=Lithospermum erythrorhizon TaxID=34254 RepID=A0AAV3RH79_LITER
MAPLSLRFRRAISTTTTLLRHHHLLSSPPLLHRLIPQAPPLNRLPPPSRSFTSTTISHSYRPRSFDNNADNDEIGPDTILFPGCDYNHWLIVIDFPKDNMLSSHQMVQFYEETATKVFGSLEEAKKKIYACSTTTYKGFQVECSEETSEKFKDLPGVIFVLPDSYTDPVNNEYGGDKYENGHITPRPPPIQYGRSGPRREFRSRASPRGPMEGENRNYGPPVTPQNPPQQGYNQPCPSQQHYGPPHQNYGPPQQQNYGPPPQQNYGPPPQRQNYGPPPQQNYGPPPQQSYGPPQQQNYRAPPQQNYGPPPQQNYGPPPQNFGPPGGEGRGPVPPSNVHSGWDNPQSGRERMPSSLPHYNQGDQRNYGTLENRDFPEPPSLGGNIEQAPPTVQGQDPGAAYGQNYQRQY